MFTAQTLYLAITTLATYLWVNSTTLSPYTLQLIAGLALIYLFLQFIPTNKSKSRQVITIDILILTTITLLLITETGGLTSPLMFLIYLLLFAVALIFEIQVTLSLTLALILYFTFLPSTNLTSLTQITEIIALLLITPLAIFTSHQYDLAQEEKLHLEHEETDTLLFISLNLKPTLAKILDTLSYIIPKISTYSDQEKLKQTYQDLRQLFQAAQKLETDVDRETDNS